MLLTGQYLYQYSKNKWGMPYTGYWSPAVWNKMFEDCLIQAIEQRYQTEQQQKWKDEMNQFISTNVRVTNIGDNSLNLLPIAITSLTNPSSTNWVLTTNIPFAPQAVAAKIDIQGVTGFGTNPNGQFTITSFGTDVKGTTIVNFTAPAHTSGSYNINTGYFSLQNTSNTIPNQLIDYIHLLNVKCNFTKPVYIPLVSSSTDTTPVTVTLNWYNNFRSSSNKNDVMVTMSGWVHNTSANGNFYIKKINDLQFQLYTDINLQTPVAGIANETASGVTLGLTYYNAARPYLSTEKISTQNTPTEKNPRYEIAEGRMTFYGDPYLNIPCTEVTIDYVCKPKYPYVLSTQNDIYSGVYVDANDNVFDVSTIYGEKLPFNIIDRMGLVFSGTSRDQQLSGISSEQLQANP